MKNILLYSGSLNIIPPFFKLYKALNNSNEFNIKILISNIYQEPSNPYFENLCFDENISYEINYLKYIDLNNIDISLVKKVLSDTNIQLLWTRFTIKSKLWRLNPLERNNINYSLIISAFELIKKYKFDEILFLVNPHNLPIYIFSKVCEVSGLSTKYVDVSPFPWRFYIRSKNQIETNKSLKDQNFLNDIKKFVEEKKQMINLPKNFTNYKFQNNFHKLMFKQFYALKANKYNIYNFLKQKESYKQYKNIVSIRSEFRKNNYAVFFLHYQPEDTTLPMGNVFAQQLIAIQYLSAAIEPLGINLVVREHPMTFKFNFNTTWRPKNFYKSIQNISRNIVFDDVNQDTKSLLFNSLLAASISGTVLVEASIIGTPIVCFGNHNLQYLNEDYIVDKFKDANDLRNRIIKAIKFKRGEIQKSMHNNLNILFEKTYGSYDFKGSKNMNIEEFTICKYLAIKEYFGL